jgi:hypothetical protein
MASTISGDTRAIAQVAGSTHYAGGIDLIREDSIDGFKYHLLRLELVGLSEQDREELNELARLAFQESEVAEAVERIKQRESASELAVAIADIVNTAQGSKKAAMLGAVFGAYSGLNAVGESGDNRLQAVLGGIAGAVAASANSFTDARLGQDAWAKYAQGDQ